MSNEMSVHDRSDHLQAPCNEELSEAQASYSLEKALIQAEVPKSGQSL